MFANKDVDGLIKALKHNQTFVREQAAKALGALADQRANDPLIQALRDESIDVRQKAKEALESFNIDNSVFEQTSLALQAEEINMAQAEHRIYLSGGRINRLNFQKNAQQWKLFLLTDRLVFRNTNGDESFSINRRRGQHMINIISPHEFFAYCNDTTYRFTAPHEDLHDFLETYLTLGNPKQFREIPKPIGFVALVILAFSVMSFGLWLLVSPDAIEYAMIPMKGSFIIQKILHIFGLTLNPTINNVINKVMGAFIFSIGLYYSCRALVSEIKKYKDKHKP
jgi:hypothetical protein